MLSDRSPLERLIHKLPGVVRRRAFIMVAMSKPRSVAPRYLAPAQVAELLSIGVDEVVALLHDGTLEGARLGLPPRWRISEGSVAAYVEDRVEEARLMHLWHQSDTASVAEFWSPPHRSVRGAAI
jgi:excisionase family DNA binding protein